MKNFSKEIKAYALKNAVEFGKADASKILPKLFQHGLEKKGIPAAIPQITKIVAEINALSVAEIKKEFAELKEIVKEREEKEKTLPELTNIGKEVITRLPPEPSKQLHLGHALSFLVNAHYAKKYNGKCILRFEDANPEKVAEEYVQGIIEDIEDYLKISIVKITYVSDDLPALYNYAEQLIKKEAIYMCFCEREKMQTLRHEGKECECRSRTLSQNKEIWNKALKGEYREGETVARLKGNMKSLNHVMRDPVLFRINKAKHFRQGKKYCVWPTYDFYNPIEDSVQGVTHILRSNEFDTRIELHEYLKKILGLTNQTIVQYGRFAVIGAETKGREIKEKISAGEYSGWDDPRLMTLKALKRRGIKVEVLNGLVQRIGLAKKEIKIDFAMIASISRKILDKETPRYYFIPSPIELKIEKMPSIKEVKIKFHPDKEETRIVKTGKKIFISQTDYSLYKGKEIRLMNFCNIKLNKKTLCTGIENKPIQKIQWVSEGISTRIKMDDGTWLSGLAESAIQNLKEGGLIQFERFGFVRLDKKTSSAYEFWFSHK